MLYILCVGKTRSRAYIRGFDCMENTNNSSVCFADCVQCVYTRIYSKELLFFLSFSRMNRLGNASCQTRKYLLLYIPIHNYFGIQKRISPVKVQ